MCKTESDNISTGDLDKVGTIHGARVVVGMVWRFDYATFSKERVDASWQERYTIQWNYFFSAFATGKGCTVTFWMSESLFSVIRWRSLFGCWSTIYLWGSAPVDSARDAHDI